MTTPLFNKYEAMNDAGNDLHDHFRYELRRFVDTYKDKHSLNEMEGLLIGTLTGLFAEERLMRAMAMKRKERANAK